MWANEQASNDLTGVRSWVGNGSRAGIGSGAILGADDFGAQGGDPVRAVDIDLSTCVNRYGPAPAVIEALRRLEPGDLVMHPYDAGDRLREAYAATLEVDASELLPTRAASEIIWALGRTLDPRAVAVPLPAYTDYLRVFPHRGFGGTLGAGHTVEQIDAALTSARLVIISNPHNPTGSMLCTDELSATARRHPRSVLVVDESYVEFVPDPAVATMLGCAAENVVVLRSASKFYGIAATRAGVAWCRDHRLLDRLVGPRENWGLSGLDAIVASVALGALAWAAQIRRRLLADSQWLADLLRGLPGWGLEANRNVHFQFARSARAETVAESVGRAGVGVRVLGPAHGIHPGALRVLAPRVDERDRVEAALRASANLACAR